MNVIWFTDEPRPDFYTKAGEWIDYQGDPVPAGCPVEVRPAEDGYPEWYEALIPCTRYGGTEEWVEIGRATDAQWLASIREDHEATDDEILDSRMSAWIEG